jgi:hypothetical protein
MRCSVLVDHRRSCCKWQPALKLISNCPSKLILREFKGGGGDQGRHRHRAGEKEKKKLSWLVSCRLIGPACESWLVSKQMSSNAHWTLENVLRPQNKTAESKKPL